MQAVNRCVSAFEIASKTLQILPVAAVKSQTRFQVLILGAVFIMRVYRRSRKLSAGARIVRCHARPTCCGEVAEI